MINYTKNETRTAVLIPTQKTPLGKGCKGTVYQSRLDPSKAVKKGASSNMISEFEIGKRLSSQYFAKHHEIYVKHYGNGQKKYKILMDRIEGDVLKNSFYTNTPPQRILSLLQDAGNACLELFDQKIYWRDMHAKNVFITDTGHLRAADYGCWKTLQPTDDPFYCAATQLRELQRLFYNILATGNIKDLQVSKKAPLISLGTGSTAHYSKRLYDMVRITKLLDDQNTVTAFLKSQAKKGIPIRKTMEQYIAAVLLQFEASTAVSLA